MNLNADQRRGLTRQQVEESRRLHGANVLTPPKEESLWRLFLDKFKDPLIIVLLMAGVLSVLISCYEYFALHQAGTVFFEPVGIFMAIFLATGLSFYFEKKAEDEFKILNQVNDDELVQVIRTAIPPKYPKRMLLWVISLSSTPGRRFPPMRVCSNRRSSMSMSRP